MSCGTFPIQLERFFGAEFGPIRPAAEINNTIFHAGEGARGIVSTDGPGGGHYFNIVRFAGEVLLLDGQLGRLVSWAEYPANGFDELSAAANELSFTHRPSGKGLDTALWIFVLSSVLRTCNSASRVTSCPADISACQAYSWTLEWVP